jgi:hypothetical protein
MRVTSVPNEHLRTRTPRNSIAPRIIDEVHRLHGQVAELAQDAGGVRGRRGRRELRAARQAEADLLRGLGFEHYDEFLAATGDQTPEETMAPVPVSLPAPASDLHPVEEAAQTEIDLLRLVYDAQQKTVDELRARIGALEEEIAEARFEITSVRNDLGSLRDRAQPGEIAPEAAVNDVLVAQLTELLGELRRERAEIAEIRVRTDEEAKRALDAVQCDAEQAHAEACALVERARAEAIALTRNALVTIDGLQRIAELDRVKPPPGG